MRKLSQTRHAKVLDALVKIESFTESKRFNYLTQGVKQFKYSNSESSVTGQRTSDFTKRALWEKHTPSVERFRSRNLNGY